MNRVEKLGSRYPIPSSERMGQQSLASSWALVGGLLAATSAVQALLAARILVQVLALEGRVADFVYNLGGFFQGPFEGYSAGAIRTRGIFEPETVLAMSAYAGIALGAAVAVGVIKLSLHKLIWESVVAVSDDLGRLTTRAVSEAGRRASAWTSETGIPAARRGTTAAFASARKFAVSVESGDVRKTLSPIALFGGARSRQTSAWPLSAAAGGDGQRPILLRGGSSRHPEDDHAA